MNDQPSTNQPEPVPAPTSPRPRPTAAQLDRVVERIRAAHTPDGVYAGIMAALACDIERMFPGVLVDKARVVKFVLGWRG